MEIYKKIEIQGMTDRYLQVFDSTYHGVGGFTSALQAEKNSLHNFYKSEYDGGFYTFDQETADIMEDQIRYIEEEIK